MQTERNFLENSKRFIRQNSLKIAPLALLPAAVLGGARNHEVQAEGRVFVNGGVWRDGANAVVWQDDKDTIASEAYRVMEQATPEHVVDAIWMLRNNRWDYWLPSARESSTIREVPKLANLVLMLRKPGGTGGPEPAPTPAEASREGFNKELAQGIVVKINEARQAAGLSQVRPNVVLTSIAEDYSKILYNNLREVPAGGSFILSHEIDGSNLSQRYSRGGYPPSTRRGEILILGWESNPPAWQNVTPDVLVKAWLNSPGHNVIMNDPIYREIGVGCAYGEINAFRQRVAVICTGDFATPR